MSIDGENYDSTEDVWHAPWGPNWRGRGRGRRPYRGRGGAMPREIPPPEQEEAAPVEDHADKWHREVRSLFITIHIVVEIQYLTRN